MKWLNNILLTVASVWMLTACSSSDDDTGMMQQADVSSRYINLAIAVAGGNGSTTRALPVGGEDGDGREAGFERENAVTGITLILYEDAAGINTSSNPDIQFVAYYPVSRVTKDADTRVEATYETGNQLVPHNAIDFTKTYHAIVVANANLTGSITTGSKLNDVRDLTLVNTYIGDATKPASSCGSFVMSSEQDNTLNFAATGVKTQDAAGDYYYDMSSQTLVIERMAARIDFWSKNSNGYKTSAENAAYTIPGYEYDVTSSTDKFVVTGIVPFNIVNGHATYGNEYIIKRIRTDIDDAATTNYLADETTTNYVMDPKTIAKSGTENLTSPLSGIYSLIGDGSKLENTTFNPYFHSVESMRVAGGMSTIETKENLVVAYPMENTLNAGSELYYYATGIAIVGYYYVNGTGTGTRYVYLGYLRHQGEADSYDIMPYTTPLSATDVLGSSLAMKFGIVRNNIYRVWIGSINEKGEMELKIKVKKWDPYTHSFIYM